MKARQKHIPKIFSVIKMLNDVRNGQVWNFIRKTAVGEREDKNRS